MRASLGLVLSALTACQVVPTAPVAQEEPRPRVATPARTDSRGDTGATPIADAGPMTSIADGGPAIVVAAPPTSTGFKVVGSVRRFEPWCAGIAPGPDDQARMRDGVPWTAPLLVRQGTANSARPPDAILTPATDGRFTLHLAPGSYCVVSEDKRVLVVPATLPQGFDRRCLVERQLACEAAFAVDASGSVTVTIGAPIAPPGGPLILGIWTPCSWANPCGPAVSPPP